jgi:dynein intermediate chain
MSTNTTEQRRAEIAAKKARLAEIKRRNQERQQSLSIQRRSTELNEVQTYIPAEVYIFGTG